MNRGVIPPQTHVAWIGRHILPHEPALRRWLWSCFPSADIDDTVQETYCRIAGLSDVTHITDPRGYLFRVARNIVLEQIRRSRVVRIDAIGGLAELEATAPPEQLSPERIASGRSELARLEALLRTLPERCRRIVRMRKFDEMPQREIAERLGLTETIVENEISRGLKLILKAMTGKEEKDQPSRPRRQNDDRSRSRFQD